MEEIVIGTYIVCALLFIMALSGLSSHETSKRGNMYGITAMALAIVATFFDEEFDNKFLEFLPPFIIGGIIGIVIALKVNMINIPQMVAALHSFVGLAATLVGISEFLLYEKSDTLPVIETAIAVFIGGLTFTGSIVAYGKLEGIISSEPLILCGWFRHVINLSVIIGAIALSVAYGVTEDRYTRFSFLMGIVLLAFFIGWHLVMAIGGADMPVVVSMLNSYSGWTTSASGFLLENNLLITAGALIGSSGAILSYIMCKAMNRSFLSVISGGFGIETETETKELDKDPLTIECKDLSRLLQDSKDIIIVPGYGMAVARCQHDVGTLVDILRKHGKRVRFCIHPVAGRLPGHMDVLLAEAEVDYKIVFPMEEINRDFATADLSIVIGANDIVNPDAMENPKSPIAGMPVCHVWESKHTVVFKRGAGKGYAKIENSLFIKDNCRMFYGSADKTVKELLNEYTAATMDIKIGDITMVEEEEKKEEEHEEYPDPVMWVGVPKEVIPGERRVSVTPSSIKHFRRLGFGVIVESGAGISASYDDQAYENAQAQVGSLEDVWRCPIVLKFRKPTEDEERLFGELKFLISYIAPAQNIDWLGRIGQQYPELIVLAMDCVPRITRAQKLDSISSMSNIAGYRAVIEAFNYFQRCPKPMTTAAGSLPPAKVLVLGAGVAGLAAIGYCKSLGCQVKAMDSRPEAVKDAESMGAEFVHVKVQESGTGAGGYARVMSAEYTKAQQETIARVAKDVDIIISTALIPGRDPPLLITEEALQNMKMGSVIVDMAAAQNGGNCRQTMMDEAYFYKGRVTLIGFTDLVSRMAPQASELYANNLINLLTDMGGAEKLKENADVNLDDDILGEMAVLHKSQVRWIPFDQRPRPPAPPQQEQPLTQHTEPVKRTPKWYDDYVWILAAICLAGILIGLSFATYTNFMNLFLVFILSVFIGFIVIWNVTPALHSPLMSETNAISGIIVVGAMIELDANKGWIDEGSAVGIVAVLLASINIFGGFVLTYRILSQFRTKS